MELCNLVMYHKKSHLHNFPAVMLLVISLTFLTMTKSEDCFHVTIQAQKTADCRQKHFKIFPEDMERDIKVLLFQNNLVTVLKNLEFNRYVQLQKIDLTRNDISIIAPRAFEGLSNLQLLDLEGNELKEIPTQAISNLLSLRFLNLKSNQIRHIANDSLKTLVNLETFNVENCYITVIESYAFSTLHKLEELNIAGNDLKTLYVEMNNTLPTTLNVVRLHNNPWHCDCHLRWFRDLLSAQDINWRFYHNTPMCYTPPLIKDATWKQLSSSQFACPAIINVPVNSSTIFELFTDKNITIDCHVQGDPEPMIIWIKDKEDLPKKGKPNEYTISTIGGSPHKTISRLTLFNTKPEHVGDYKCIAQNNGGRSEVTFKVWMKGIQPGIIKSKPKDNQGEFILGLKKEIFLAIFISIGLLIVTFLIAIIVCLVMQQNKQRHAYKVREYHRQANNGKKECRVTREEIAEQVKPRKPKNTKVVDKDIIYDKKHLLEDCKKEITTADLQVIAHTLVKVEEIPKQSSNKMHEIKEKDQSPQKQGDFKMKIFATYNDDETTARQNEEKELAKAVIETPNENIEDGGANSNNVEVDNTHTGIYVSTRGRDQNINQRDTPDLLKDRVLTSRAIPVPPPLVPNHISSDHPRAKENPYVTSHEIKAAANMKRKTASADDLLDNRDPYIQQDEPSYYHSVKRSSSRDDLNNPNNNNKHSNNRSQKEYSTLNNQKKTRFREPLIKPRDHASTCTNPVCLKDHPCVIDTLHSKKLDSTLPRQNKPSVKFKQWGRDGHREIDVDDMSSPDSRYDSHTDGYKTMPARMAHSNKDTAYKHYTPPGTSQSSPAKSPLNQRYTKLPPKQRGYIPTKTVSFSDEGHPIIDLTQEMPEPIVLTSCDQVITSGIPPASRDCDYNKPNPQWYTTMPHITQHHPHPHPQPPPPKSKTLGTHKMPNGSPPSKPSRTKQGTTLDDLLSPPFGRSPTSERGTKIQQGSRTLPHRSKKQIKPGEKDEFGTAV